MTLKGGKTEGENCDRRRLTSTFFSRKEAAASSSGRMEKRRRRKEQLFILLQPLSYCYRDAPPHLSVQLRDVPVRNRKKNETGPWKEEEQKIGGSNASAAKKEREIFNLIMRKTLERISFSYLRRGEGRL